ncbi:MAG: ComEA family DNA-binding protein [Oscillospiraceae bacterium]
MKLSKAEWAICVVAGVFLLFCGGYFAGSHSGAEPYQVTVQRQNPEATAPVPSQQVLEGLMVNINTASAGELTALPAIGEKRAQDIVTYREKNGSFARKEDLTDVPGIGQATLEGLLNYITVGGAGT